MLEKHFYCVKCQSGKTVVGQSPVMFKNGAVALKGRCPSCQSETYKIMNRQDLHRKVESVRRVDSVYAVCIMCFALGVVLGIAATLYL